LLAGLAVATAGCAATSPSSSLPPAMKDDPVAVAICDSLPKVVSSVRTCRPGNTKKALCSGRGLRGERTCNANGTGWSPTNCIAGGVPVNQFATYLIVTRPELQNAVGFQGIVSAIVRDGFVVGSVAVEDLVQAFPAPTVSESIRLGLQHLKHNEMPDFKYVLLVGKPEPGLDTNRPFLNSGVEMPLWYLETPPGTGTMDWVREESIPSALPYSHLEGDWPDEFGQRFWTPDMFRADVHVGLLPATGQVWCNSAAECLTDLQVYAEKRASWDPGTSFTLSLFDGLKCAGENWDITADDDVHDGVTRVSRNHACQGGERGDMGPLAVADGADAMLYADHGNQFGVGGAYQFGMTTEFPGIVYGHSCLTGAPDLSGMSLGEYQMFNRNGAVSFTGFGRVEWGGYPEPFSAAFKSGRRTVGEVMDGFREDMTRYFSDRKMVRNMASMFVYGDPAVALYDKPTVSVRTLASRPSADGGIEACVEVKAEPSQSVTLKVGGIEVGSAETGRNGAATVAVTVPSEVTADREAISVAECDPSKETCLAAGLNPLAATGLLCSPLLTSADGSLALSVGSSEKVTGKGLAYEVSVLAYGCVEGNQSACYLDSWSLARRRHVVSVQPTPEVAVGENLLAAFDFDGLGLGENEIVGAVEVRLLNSVGNSIAECHPPLDLDTAEDLDLL
jgi:hypothetical protein